MTEFRDLVAKHHKDSSAILVASREPCVAIAYDERVNAHGRAFQIVGPEELPSFQPPESWIMGVLLCPGDDTVGIASWADKHQIDGERIVFYIHRDTEYRAALKGWVEAGFSVHASWTIRSWRELHKHFGAAWNVRVFDDFR